MKKIFFILSVLFIGLLVGCASKPANNSSFEQKQIRPTVEPAQIDMDDEVWTKFSYFDMVNNLGSIPDDLSKIDSLQHPIRPAVKNKFFDIANSSEISGYDFWVLIAICKWSKNGSRNEIELYGESKQWAEEFLNDKNITDKKNFTVKIINKTNEVLPANAVIEVGRAGENKLFDLTVPANSEKYFTFPSELLEGHIPNVFLPEWNTWGMNYMGTDFCQYIINNYSLEIVYDKDLIYFEEKDDRLGYHHESYLCESWKFVPRYKSEENIIKNIPWGKPKNPNTK